MADYNYPVELIKKAEARIQKQVNGNGIDPKSITLAVKRQGLGIFSAETSFELDIDIKATQIKGRQSDGEHLDAGKTQETVQAYISDLKSKDSFNSEIKEKIKSLALSGFGGSGDIIQLGGYKKSYCEHTPCGTCQGKGQATCGTCRGQGQSQCQLCYARGLIKCMFCNGMGEIQNGENKQICTQCQGRREVFCTQCHGQKMTQCMTCQTKGTISCGSCNGGGVNTIHTTVTPLAKISSAIHLQELDDEPKILANKIGALKLAKGGHIDIEQIKPPEDENDVASSEMSYYEDEATTSNTNKTVYYQSSMPWSIAEIQIDSRPYNISFVGKKGAVCDSQPFMDDILKTSLNQIQNAAKGNGFVAGLLKDACELRVSRETLSLVATKNRKKALVELGKNYNIGFGKGTLHGLVQNSYLALQRITRRPRYIGLCVGLIISAVIYYYWFMSGGRTFTSAHPINTRYAMDAIPLIIGLLVTVISIKGAGFFVFKNLMRDIGVKTNKMPALGTAGLYAVIGNLLLWGGVFGFEFFLS